MCVQINKNLTLNKNSIQEKMNYDFGQSQKRERSALPDPYDILGIERGCDIDTIKHAFRKATRLHHPDRNRRNSNYDPKYYAAICQAYETLSDPRRRAQIDQSMAAGFSSLKNASMAPPQQQARSGGAFNVREQFSEGDNKQFNEAFERSRKMTANDRGYGDKMIARESEQELKNGRRNVEAPQNVFGGTSVNSATFNNKFQEQLRDKRQQRNALMERSEGEPQGWFQGSGGGFSDISMFDGVIVDREHEDFSKTDRGSLHYADYMAGFETLTETLPEEHEYYNPGDIEKAHSRRLQESSQLPDRGHNMSFAESQQALLQQRDQKLAHENQHNRQLVLKYRDQYSSQDLLPAMTSSRNADSNINRNMQDRTFFQPNRF